MSNIDTKHRSQAGIKKAKQLMELLQILSGGLIGTSVGVIALVVSIVTSGPTKSDVSLLLLLGAAMLIISLAVAVISMRTLSVLDPEDHEEKEA